MLSSRTGLLAGLLYCAFTATVLGYPSADHSYCTTPAGPYLPAYTYATTARDASAPDVHTDLLLAPRIEAAQYESDYYILYSYYNLETNYCNNIDRIQLKAHRDDFRNGSNNLLWEYISPDADKTGSHKRLVGPGKRQKAYITVFYRGKFPGNPAGAVCEIAVEFDGGPITGYTAEIFDPENVSASDGTDDTDITITWEKGTDIPDDLHEYRIYRDSVLIHTTADGTVREYRDTTRQPGNTHTYRVTTFSSFYDDDESPGVSDEGSTFSVELVATDGTKYNATSLAWNDLSDYAEEIRIERSTPNATGREELAIISGNARGYNDNTGIPGYNYTYYVTPIGGDFLTATDTGYSRPDGSIKGHVRSSLGAGVSGVTVTLTLEDTIPAGGTVLPSDCTATYCTTTDIEGYYEFLDVYYFEGAEFTVKPSKSGSIVHEFSPVKARRSLTLNAKSAQGVDFTDLTVFTAAGRVTYPESPNGVTCGVAGVRILIDDTDYGVLTDRNGNWSFAIQDEDTYTFTPVYLHHRLENGTGAISTSVVVDRDHTDIDFEDKETDTLRVVVQGSCQEPLGDYATVRIYSPQNCYVKEYDTDVNGILELTDLPARDYMVEVIDISGSSSNLTNIEDQIGGVPIKVDLTVRDTSEIVTVTETTTYIEEIRDSLSNDSIVIIQAADTILAGTRDTVRAAVHPTVSFIYRAPLKISIDYDDTGAIQTECVNSEGDPIVVMEQGTSYRIDIEVKEILGSDCHIDTGFLKIYDFVSDRGSKFVRVPIRGGIASYQIDAGEPIIASSSTHNHEKLLYIIPEVDLVDPVPVESWILVTGAKSNTPSFITRTPDIPMLILHDPPGDNSYSYVEKGTSYTNFTTNESLVGGEAGVYANVLLGVKTNTLLTEFGAGATVKFSAVAGRDNFNRNGTYTTMTFTENFSTSDLDNLTGEGGDVYIGAAYNQEFALADYLTFDEQTCLAEVDVVPSLSSQDFATTFVYTETHIKNTLLPTLGLLRANILDDRPVEDLSKADLTEVNNLIRDSLAWEEILAKNDTARGKDAKFEENISFSAGAPILREYENDTVTTVSYEYNTFVDTEFAVGAKIENEGGLWVESEFGVMGKFRWSTTTNAGDDTTRTRKVGYVLDDGDIGDFFSVDILTDESYNVPAFDLKLGTTSCPQEPGSQARDRPTIRIGGSEITNIPADGAANLVCQIANLSESRETREYAVRVISTTNPDGAQVRLGGHLINNGAAHFDLPYGETASLNLSVTRGPLASQYADIGIMIYPPCEYDLAGEGGELINADTAYIKLLQFETECTNIALRKPDDGWLINQNSGDTLRTTLSGYDLNNETFEHITVEIKKEGQGYINVYQLDTNDLTGANYDLSLDLSNYEDGTYWIRATASCGRSGVTFSSEKRGTIDRNSLAPYGIPTPSDGFLRFGEEISVSFDKDIDCNLVNDYDPVIRLQRADTGEEIPATAACFGNKLIINTTPHLTEMPQLQGVEIQATVANLRDLNGNVQKYATNWSFLVNVNPVFWDPDPIHASGLEGSAHIITGVLKNNTLISKAFSLDTTDDGAIRYPAWLTPLQTRGTILPNNDYHLDFAVSEELSPGIYHDTITARVEDRAVSVPVTFQLLAREVNWAFDPNAYEYDMTIVAQFSLDGTNDLLSDDPRDLIGAFVGGQIRGVANLEYVAASDTYAAYLKVHSNDLGGKKGETITFRFWHALNGVEYGAEEELTFEANDHVGSTALPFILHPEGIFQSIPLNKGWNWISLNVATDDMSREQVFQSIMSSSSGNNIVVKSQENSAEYSYLADWKGKLDTIELGQGYLVHLSDAPDTLKVVGLPSPDSVTVSVDDDWNWIGYPRLHPEPVNDVLSNLSVTEGDIIKGKSAFALFEAANGGWTGSLRQFTPGAGYKLKSSNTGSIVHPAQKSNQYRVERGRYEHNMNITGEFDAELLGESNYTDLEVIALLDGECRGIGSMEFCPSEDNYRAFLLVSGNSADYGLPLEFRIVNTVTGEEYRTNGDEQTFGVDYIVGSVADPYPFFGNTTSVSDFTRAGFALGANRPNPATGTTVIPFTIPATQSVMLQIYDLNGRLVKIVADQTYGAGDHEVTVDISTYPPGMYIYRMQTTGFERSRRMVVQ
ncbi:T9SS type A sorting domain-containing protein [Lewinella sp. JB7]|uniref:T9SS type A sorting domain-containing protein n=1 Tax=Lewinella sp. JB7 TaxID=2962887 RepID=UPI0020C946FB|nr:T9SS type A sorting domain-containing protein [Lewinella sp. JB7]MCP9237685.1 T9SS type A sorting domain-containing protein [Lewinella sp. JB7]